jgi:hypothetical protein
MARSRPAPSASCWAGSPTCCSSTRELTRPTRGPERSHGVFVHRDEMYVAGAPAQAPHYRLVCHVPEGRGAIALHRLWRRVRQRRALPDVPSPRRRPRASHARLRREQLDRPESGGCRTERRRRGADHPLHRDHFHGEGKRDQRPGATSAGELHVVSREAERMASLIRAARWLSSSGATCRPGQRKWRANQSGEPI